MLLGTGCGGPEDATEGPSAEELETTTQALSEVHRQEAENEPYSSSYPRAVGYGHDASGQAFLALNVNGGPYFQWYAPSAGYYRLAPRLLGTYCAGWPIAGMFIDAKQLAYVTVTGTWQYPQSDWIYLQAGWHTYAIGLQNDYAGGGCDRNLWFDYLVVHRY
jgi:hypothetical protein